MSIVKSALCNNESVLEVLYKEHECLREKASRSKQLTRLVKSDLNLTHAIFL